MGAVGGVPTGQGGVPTLVHDDAWYKGASGRYDEDYTLEKAVIGAVVGYKGIMTLIDVGKSFFESPVVTAPKPSPKFRTPSNPAQNPPNSIPDGYTLRVMPPTEQYPNGYWIMEKPMPQGGSQGINPATMRPGPRWDTHVPLPFGYW